MPLQNSCSIDAFRANVAELIKSGRDPSQAAAIAHDTLRESCKSEGKETPRMDSEDMPRVQRFDGGAMSRAVKTDAGFLRVPATISRTGVLIYRFADGTQRRELRLPEEVFKADSLATLQMVPVTNDHPSTVSGLLDTDTAKSFTVGNVGEVITQNGEMIQANLMITDAKTIKEIDIGNKRQASAGYTTSLEFNPGTYKGQPYDAIQRDIKYNHVAIVKMGRAGHEVKLHLDSATEIEETEIMEKITIDGVDFEVSPQAAQAFKRELAKLGGEVSKQTARGDSLTAEVERERKARTDAQDPSKLMEAVKARLDLERKAGAILGEAIKLDVLSDSDIRSQVITKVNPSMTAKLKDAEPAYVMAAFDMACDSYKPVAPAPGLGAARKGATGEPEIKTDSEAVRLAFIKTQNGAWKKPLSAKEGVN